MDIDITVRQPSGASFDVKVDLMGSVVALKAAIAAHTKVAVSRQKLLFCAKILLLSTPISALCAGEGRPEVLLLVSYSSCTLASHSHSPLVIWDSDAQMACCPDLARDADFEFQSAVDAMRLDDGEIYVLQRSATSDGLHFLQLCRASWEVCRYSLPSYWIDEGMFAQFSPEGDFVIAGSHGDLLVWHTLSGAAHVRSDGADWTGSLCCLQPGIALIESGNLTSRVLELWDLPAGTCRQSWQKEADWTISPAYLLSASGAWIAAWDYTGPLEVWAVERDGSRNPRSFSDLSVHQAAFSPDEKEIVVVQLDIYQALGPILVSRFTSKTIGNMRVQSPGCLIFVSPSELVIRGNSKILRNSLSLSLSLSRSCVFWTSVGCIARSCLLVNSVCIAS
ncbi:GIP [Symbiodinium necroappetens]|uniref:GIP protein n=1 Tax=Symbiodinium necroappetens TaxID=1628268 RepID=A0A812ZI42_9DINO|nr:GIP [Symbiodinium necroappetens]